MARDLRGTKKEKDFYAAFGDPIKITANVLVNLFAGFYNKKTGKMEIAYYPDDLITVTENEFPGVKPTTTTTGIYIANKAITEDLKVVGYVNKTFSKDVIGKLDEVTAEALKADDITMEQMFHYIDACQWLFGGKLAHVINTSLSSNMLQLPPKAKKLRKDLFDKYSKELNVDNDPLVASKIEKEVTSVALEEMRAKHDPAMNLFDSKCGVDPYNNYKTMFVMKGAVKDNTGLYKTGYKVATSDYDMGLTIEDQAKVADNLVTSSYASGVKTQDAGYEAKKYNATMQNIQLGPKGSDCGTTDTEEITIDESNAHEWGQYHYIMENGKPVRLTPKNINSYMGKKVHMRVPDRCKMRGDQYCNVCFGDRSYMIDVTNIGLAMNIACGAMLNASLKTKHDTTIKSYELDIDRDLLMFA